MAATNDGTLVRANPDLRALRLTYALSVAVLVVLALGTVISPVLLPTLVRREATLPEEGKIQILAKSDEWVLQYNLVNGAGTPGDYTFELSSMDAARVLHTDAVRLDAGRTFVFIYHVRPEQVGTHAVRFTVRRAGDATAVEDLKLHLTPERGG